MKEKIDTSNKEQIDRFDVVTNQILEKVKATKHSRIRTLSTCSSSSKRSNPFEDEPGREKSSVRPKTSSGIPTKQ